LAAAQVAVWVQRGAQAGRDRRKQPDDLFADALKQLGRPADRLERVRIADRRSAYWTEQAHPKAASRGTEAERGRSPPDLLRRALRERPVTQCQELT
jgi:hypothetical protein